MESNVETTKITILCSKKRFREAEDVFMKLVNAKEGKKNWFCTNHQVSNRNGKINRTYLYKYEDKDKDIVKYATVSLLTEPDQKGMRFDNVICIGQEVERCRVKGYILTL